ncbi:hypothetical protein ACFWF7_14690 [Nocardia sp. NPDC060256]|uniref:hypothetical protein n=1 Tax=Nocardia sp. NPDC060256 TaxID=3347086 RepID=UPI003653466B
MDNALPGPPRPDTPRRAPSTPAGLSTAPAIMAGSKSHSPVSNPPVTKPAPTPANPPPMLEVMPMPKAFTPVISKFLATQLLRPLPMKLATGTPAAAPAAPVAPATKICFKS